MFFRRLAQFLGCFVFASVLVGCSLFQSTASGPPIPIDDPYDPSNAVILFSEDFTGYELGTVPAGWEPRNPDHATVLSVVDDPTAKSGRAFRIAKLEGVAPSNTDIGATGPIWDNSEISSVTTVAIEFEIRHITGYMNLYSLIWPEGPIQFAQALHMTLGTNGNLGFHGGHFIGNLVDGWNRIRVVANSETDQAYVFLNDMSTPAGGPFTFRTKIESWENSRLRYWAAAGGDATVDVYISDIKAWIVE